MTRHAILAGALVVFGCGGSGGGRSETVEVTCVDTFVYDHAEVELVSSDDATFCQGFVDLMQYEPGSAHAVDPSEKASGCKETDRTFDDKLCSLTIYEECGNWTQRWDCSYRADSATCSLTVNATLGGIWCPDAEVSCAVACEIRTVYANAGPSATDGSIGDAGP